MPAIPSDQSPPVALAAAMSASRSAAVVLVALLHLVGAGAAGRDVDAGVVGLVEVLQVANNRSIMTSS